MSEPEMFSARLARRSVEASDGPPEFLAHFAEQIKAQPVLSISELSRLSIERHRSIEIDIDEARPLDELDRDFGTNASNRWDD